MNNLSTESTMENNQPDNFEIDAIAQKLLDNVGHVLIDSIMMRQEAQQIKDQYPEGEMPPEAKIQYQMTIKMAQASARTAVHYIEDYNKVPDVK
jgi:hypothetical protein